MTFVNWQGDPRKTQSIIAKGQDDAAAGHPRRALGHRSRRDRVCHVVEGNEVRLRRVRRSVLELEGSLRGPDRMPATLEDAGRRYRADGAVNTTPASGDVPDTNVPSGFSSLTILRRSAVPATSLAGLDAATLASSAGSSSSNFVRVPSSAPTRFDRSRIADA